METLRRVDRTKNYLVQDDDTCTIGSTSTFLAETLRILYQWLFIYLVHTSTVLVPKKILLKVGLGLESGKESRQIITADVGTLHVHSSRYSTTVVRRQYFWFSNVAKI